LSSLLFCLRVPRSKYPFHNLVVPLLNTLPHINERWCGVVHV